MIDFGLATYLKMDSISSFIFEGFYGKILKLYHKNTWFKGALMKSVEKLML